MTFHVSFTLHWRRVKYQIQVIFRGWSSGLILIFLLLCTCKYFPRVLIAWIYQKRSTFDLPSLADWGQLFRLSVRHESGVQDQGIVIACRRQSRSSWMSLEGVKRGRGSERTDLSKFEAQTRGLLLANTLTPVDPGVDALYSQVECPQQAWNLSCKMVQNSSRDAKKAKLFLLQLTLINMEGTSYSTQAEL